MAISRIFSHIFSVPDYITLIRRLVALAIDLAASRIIWSKFMSSLIVYKQKKTFNRLKSKLVFKTQDGKMIN